MTNTKQIDMEKQLKWIYPTKVKNKYGNIYEYFYVRRNRQYLYSSQRLEDAQDFVIRFAKKNNIQNIYK